MKLSMKQKHLEIISKKETLMKLSVKRKRKYFLVGNGTFMKLFMKENHHEIITKKATFINYY